VPKFCISKPFIVPAASAVRGSALYFDSLACRDLPEETITSVQDATSPGVYDVSNHQALAGQELIIIWRSKHDDPLFSITNFSSTKAPYSVFHIVHTANAHTCISAVRNRMHGWCADTDHHRFVL